MKPPEEERERGPRGTGEQRGRGPRTGPRPARQVSVNGGRGAKATPGPPTRGRRRAPGSGLPPGLWGGTEAPHALRSCRPLGDGRVWGRDAEGETAKRNRKTSKRKGKRFPNRWATQGAMAGELGRPRPAGARKASHTGARRPSRKTQERGPESRRESTTFHAGSNGTLDPDFSADKPSPSRVRTGTHPAHVGRGTGLSRWAGHPRTLGGGQGF